MIDLAALSSWIVQSLRELALVPPPLLAFAAVPTVLALLGRNLLALAMALVLTGFLAVLLRRYQEPETQVLIILAWTAACVTALAGFAVTRAKKRERQRQAALVKLRGDVELLSAFRERLLLRSIESHNQPQSLPESWPRLRAAAGIRDDG